MIQSQKIIKSIAFSVALVLVLMILCGLVTGTYSVLKAIGLIENKNIILGNYKEKEINSIVKSLNIDLVNTNIYIKRSDIFKIESNNNDIEINNNEGYINIKDTSLNIFNNPNKELIIYINKDIEFLSLENTNGDVNIDSIITNTLDLDLGVGKVEISNIEVKKELILDSGVGKTTITSSVINNLQANLGVGEFNFSGEILGESKIDSGIGNSKLLLNGNIDKYQVKVNKGLGKITINEEEINNTYIYGNGSNNIILDGGLGNININFNKEI